MVMGSILVYTRPDPFVCIITYVFTYVSFQASYYSQDYMVHDILCLVSQFTPPPTIQGKRHSG